MFNQLFFRNPIKYPDLIENKIRTYLEFKEVSQLDQVYQAMINGQDLILLEEGDNLKYIPSSVFWKDGETPSILYYAYHLNEKKHIIRENGAFYYGYFHNRLIINPIPKSRSKFNFYYVKRFYYKIMMFLDDFKIYQHLSKYKKTYLKISSLTLFHISILTILGNKFDHQKYDYFLGMYNGVVSVCIGMYYSTYLIKY